MVLEFTDANFKSEVLESEGLVLVDFWAPWCGPCRMMGPVIEELSNEFEGQVKVGKLQVDENPITAQGYGVMGIPTLLVFEGGEAVERVVGVQNRATLSEKLTSFLS